METSTAFSGPRYQSVGGWLLLFCLGLIFFTPLLTINSLITAHSSAVQLADRYPGFLITTLVDGVLSLALAAFSVYAGVGLWRLRPGAVPTAEIYLICYLCYQGIAAVLPFMAGFPASVNHGLTEAIYKNLTRGLLYFGVWYLYLNKSKRVKATYNVCRSLTEPDLP